MSNPANQARALFLEAIEEYAPDQRAAFLDRACAGDLDLRDRVDRLLRSHELLGSFHDQPPADPQVTIQQPESESPGTVIGPYKLLQKIGEGGMGVVYMAEQSEPVERRVALKIIKPGMDTRQVIARFEAERQALAMMDHPNIARVLDAGATGGVEGQGPRLKDQESPHPSSLITHPSSRPYFVMELVKGIPITQYCDEHQLTPRERLELFLPVCQAVQHAHQKGIIHRDLKPSNILVSEYDDRPVPKVIDFGVAKAVSQRLTERTMFTQYGQIVGTLEYMSPEQAKLNELDVDTRSDVYSLGVLLYELLTGVTPLDKQRLKAAAFDEILRLIREEEPQKPSTRLSTAETLPSIAANRKTEPKKLSGLLRGELDWIVMKALEKDRSRRYETANGLAADVLRYLANEPVSACPQSAAYRFRKFARRNKAVLTSAVIVALALIAGTAVSTWQAIEASRQRDRAVSAEGRAEDRLAVVERQQTVIAAERDRAERNLDQALSSIDSMLTRVADERLTNMPLLEDVRRALYQDALHAYRELAHQGGDDPQVRLETAKAQRRLGRVLILLGRYEEAQTELSEAATLLVAIRQHSSAGAEAEIELARVWVALGTMATADAASRIALLSQAAGLYERHAAVSTDRRAVELDLAACLTSLATQQHKQGDHVTARETFESAGRLLSTMVQQNPGDREAVVQYAKYLQNFGNDFMAVGDWVEAEARFRTGAEVIASLVAKSPNDAEDWNVYAVAMLNQGAALARQEKFFAADQKFSEAIDIFEQLVRDFPSYPVYRLRLAGTVMNVCECAANLGEPVRAIASAERAVSEIERLTDTWPAVREYHSDLGGALSNLAWQLSEQERDLERAEKLAQRAIAEQRRSLETGGVNNFLMKHYSILAQIQWQLDRLSEARTTCDAGLQVVEQLEQKNPEDPDIAFNRGRFQQILGLVQQREQKANMSPAPVVERRKP